MGAHSAIDDPTPPASERAALSGLARVRLARGARRPLPWSLLASLAGVAAWLIVDPRTPDLAGQVYRADLFAEVGWSVWDSHWYAGHDIPGYSLLFPPLGASIGVRTVGALAVLASAALFAGLARRAYGAAAARWGALWFALAALGDVWSGRIAFALGVSFALGAVAARARSPARWSAPLAVTLAALCAACSPVAGALLALAGVTHFLVTRSWRSAALLGIPSLALLALLARGFGEGGWEPYPLLSFLATVAVLGGFLLALPPREPLLRTGALIYLAACVACVAVHTPMGANVERYAVLLAGPLLLCALLAGTGAKPGVARRKDAAPAEADRRAQAAWRGGRGGGGIARCAATLAALLGIAVWTAWGPVRETAAVAGDASTAASYYAPVARFVAAHGGDRVRVEVPFTRGHWEAAWLARRVALARGWEKQLDERYDAVLLAKRLTAAAYLRWLREEAVSYVALPDAPLDPSSAAEGRLVESGPAYLRPVLRTRHWRIYAVRGATPIASGPGALAGAGHDWFALRTRGAGRFVVRLRYTRYWTVAGGTAARGGACVGRAAGGWTAVRVDGPGTVVVRARFSLGRALGMTAPACRLLS